MLDDEIEPSGLLADILVLDGHIVEIVADSAAALRLLEARSYDVILSNLRMPILDGLRLYREVERHHPHLLNRFVFLTEDTLEVAAYFENMTARRLAKPFDPDEIRQVVRSVATGVNPPGASRA